MFNCSPMTALVPATAGLDIRDLDVRNLTATSVSCTNLTVNGEPVSNVLTNIGSTSAGNTVFNGTVTATNLTASGTVTAGTFNLEAIAATGAITAGSVTTTGSVVAGHDVSGATLTGTIATPTQNNITKIGTQTSFASSGSIVQSGGSTTLLGTTVSSLSSTGNISQSTGTTATLRALTADSLTTAGNITQTGSTATATLKAVTVDSLTFSGTVNGATPRLWYSLPQVNASNTTSIEILNVPGDAQVVRIHLFAISLSSSPPFADGPRIQFGADSTYTNTTYEVSTAGNSGNNVAYYSSSGIYLHNAPNAGGNWDAGYIVNGIVELSSVGNGSFVVSGNLGRLQSPGYWLLVTGYTNRANNNRFNRLRVFSGANINSGTVQVQYLK